MYQISKRIFDFISALLVLLVFLPFFVLIASWISLDSRGGIFYKQIRVGKNGKQFGLLKFRSMKVGADKQGLITIGDDSRVTRSGRFIRKTKIDELPQLINILKGEMSVVGPRPEVPKYVALYTEEQMKVLSVRPGLTDFASLKYFDEQKILGESPDPERTYRYEIMPKKLELNLQYVAQQSLLLDLKLIFSTIFRIFK